MKKIVLAIIIFFESLAMVGCQVNKNPIDIQLCKTVDVQNRKTVTHFVTVQDTMNGIAPSEVTALRRVQQAYGQSSAALPSQELEQLKSAIKQKLLDLRNGKEEITFFFGTYIFPHP